MNFINRVANKKQKNLFQLYFNVENFSRKFSLQPILYTEKKENINIGTIGKNRFCCFKDTHKLICNLFIFTKVTLITERQL